MEKINNNLYLRTSFVTPQSLREFPERGLLPIFIARNISNSGLIGKWNGTAVHFKELSPSPGLLRDWKTDKICRDEFEKQLIIELSKLNYGEILKKFSLLCKISNADGLVLMGYGKDLLNCHRGIVSDMINRCGLLRDPVKELIL